jgi:UDP-N-acetylmuramoyl-L-alanine---L-glutamate ligase
MIDFIRKKIGGKKLLILGFGREGESTFRFLKKYFPEIKIAVADINDGVQEKLDSENVEIHSGADYLNCINDFDLIFKTPGISLNHLSFSFDKNKITSQTDLFLDYYSDQIIGVTGTKGKSTTSSLIYHIVRSYTEDAVFVGNIGVPPFDLIEEIKPASRIIFELSSHQLEYIKSSPHISVLLNIFQEHLDHYKSFSDYKQSKLNIAKYQDTEDSFIFNADDKSIWDLIDTQKSKGVKYSYSLNIPCKKGCCVSDDEIYFNDGSAKSAVYDLKHERSLKGEHNILNIMAAICACRISGIPDDVISQGINSFKGLEHRIEYVGKFDGIDFYNDSIATIPEATIEALKTLKKVDTIILGGFDRGIDYTVLTSYLLSSTVQNIIFMGKAGDRMFSLMKTAGSVNKKYVTVDTMEEAVLFAKKNTLPGKICLLSPAAASYDSFKNFEERGEVYKKIVRTPL